MLCLLCPMLSSPLSSPVNSNAHSYTPWPVEEILARTNHNTLQKIYNLPPFTSPLEFLTTLALTTGRLLKVVFLTSSILSHIIGTSFSSRHRTHVIFSIRAAPQTSWPLRDILSQTGTTRKSPTSPCLQPSIRHPFLLRSLPPPFQRTR